MALAFAHWSPRRRTTSWTFRADSSPQQTTPLRDIAGAVMPPKMFTNALTCWVRRLRILNASVTFYLGGTDRQRPRVAGSAHTALMMSHRRHCQTRTLTITAISRPRDIVQVVFRFSSLDLLGGIGAVGNFADGTWRCHPKEPSRQGLSDPRIGDDQRVDLQNLHVTLDERCVGDAHKGHALCYDGLQSGPSSTPMRGRGKLGSLWRDSRKSDDFLWRVGCELPSMSMPAFGGAGQKPPRDVFRGATSRARYSSVSARSVLYRPRFTCLPAGPVWMRDQRAAQIFFGFFSRPRPQSGQALHRASPAPASMEFTLAAALRWTLRLATTAGVKFGRRVF